MSYVRNVSNERQPHKISATEAALILGRPPRAVHRMIQRGELRATKMPGLRAPYLIDRADVEALLDRKSA